MSKKKLNLARATPEETLLGFVAAWQGRKWEDMVQYVQKSWVEMTESSEFSAAEMLKAAFQFKPVDMEVLDCAMPNNSVYIIKLRIKYAIARNVVKEAVKDVRLISEIAPMAPAPNGTWGVVPNTLMVT